MHGTVITTPCQIDVLYSHSQMFAMQTEAFYLCFFTFIPQFLASRTLIAFSVGFPSLVDTDRGCPDFESQIHSFLSHPASRVSVLVHLSSWARRTMIPTLSVRSSAGWRTQWDIPKPAIPFWVPPTLALLLLNEKPWLGPHCGAYRRTLIPLLCFGQNRPRHDHPSRPPDLRWSCDSAAVGGSQVMGDPQKKL